MNTFKVPIKNVLYMYSYVWDSLNKEFKSDLDSIDDFESIDIFTELFLKNIKNIRNKGLFKRYKLENEEIKSIKGKIDFKNSINSLSFNSGKAFCEYDEMTVNNLHNQIIKTITFMLYKNNIKSSENRRKLLEFIHFLEGVDIIELQHKDFLNITYTRNNSYYKYIISICNLIFENTMLGDKKGEYKFIDLYNTDKNLANIFEKFVYKFYKQNITTHKVHFQKELKWNIVNNQYNSLLPVMKLDTVLENNNETIIIDTKYYKNFYSINQYETKKYHSNNWYQMFSYMNNINVDGNLKGILLYPKSFTNEIVDDNFEMMTVSGTDTRKSLLKISTIDLSEEWKNIENNLIKIIIN